MMREIALPTQIIEQEGEIKQKRLNRWTFVLFVTMFGGIISGLSGLILGVISYAVILENAGSINSTGNFMIIAAFPLMMFGAHALDKINEIKKDEK